MRWELVNVCYSLGRADEVFDNEKYTFCLEIIHSSGPFSKTMWNLAM